MRALVTSTVNPDARSVDIELPPVPSSAARARKAAAKLDGAAHPEAVARVRVLVSEIVTAFSLAPDAGAITLRLEADGGRLRGEVAGVASNPGRLLSGWARLLVERLSDGWGESGHGTTVWFEVTRPMPQPSTRRFAR
jgi:hypothetical protein